MGSLFHFRNVCRLCRRWVFPLTRFASHHPSDESANVLTALKSIFTSSAMCLRERSAQRFSFILLSRYKPDRMFSKFCSVFFGWPNNGCQLLIPIPLPTSAILPESHWLTAGRAQYSVVSIERSIKK